MSGEREQIQKLQAAKVSLGSNGLLLIAKVIGATLTGSVSLFSESIHSLTDVIASSLALIAIKAANEPADEGHPYGHARIETVTSLAESTLLSGLALLVLFHSVVHIFQSKPLIHLAVGLSLLMGSAVVSLIVGIYVSRVATKTESMALQSNALHLKSDFWTSFGVFIGLYLVKMTGWTALDGVIGIALSSWLFFNSWKIGSSAYEQLIDRSLPEADLAMIREILETTTGVISFHKLRTRQSGQQKFVDVHVVVNTTLSLIAAHQVADSIEKSIATRLGNVAVVTHVDPFDPDKAAKEKILTE